MMNLITTLHFLTIGFILFSPIRFYSVYSNQSFLFLVSVDCILHEKLTMFGVLILANRADSDAFHPRTLLIHVEFHDLGGC